MSDYRARTAQISIYYVAKEMNMGIATESIKSQADADRLRDWLRSPEAEGFIYCTLSVTDDETGDELDSWLHG